MLVHILLSVNQTVKKTMDWTTHFMCFVWADDENLFFRFCEKEGDSDSARGCCITVHQMTGQFNVDSLFLVVCSQWGSPTECALGDSEPNRSILSSLSYGRCNATAYIRSLWNVFWRICQQLLLPYRLELFRWHPSFVRFLVYQF